MTDTDLDFIEANQVIQAIDERLEKLYAQRRRLVARATEVTPAAQFKYDLDESALSIGKLESAKRKLSVRWYSEEPEQADDITAAKAYDDETVDEDGEPAWTNREGDPAFNGAFR